MGSQRLNYFCDADVLVYGEPDRSEPVWTVTVADEGSSILRASGVSVAWF